MGRKMISEVSEPVLKHYLYSGSVWPQLRMPLACSVIWAWASLKADASFGELLFSRLSDTQANRILRTAETIHATFAIRTSRSLDMETVHQDWSSTLNAISYLLICLRYRNAPAEWKPADDCLAHAKADSGILDLSPHSMSVFIDAIRVIDREFLLHLELARAFRATFRCAGADGIRRLLTPDRMDAEMAPIPQLFRHSTRVELLEEIIARVNARLSSFENSLRLLLVSALRSSMRPWRDD